MDKVPGDFGRLSLVLGLVRPISKVSRMQSLSLELMISVVGLLFPRALECVMNAEQMCGTHWL